MQLAFTTVDEFHALLEQAGEALDYREVWPRLFPVANCPPELMRRLVADIVEGVLGDHDPQPLDSLDAVEAADGWARAQAERRLG